MDFERVRLLAKYVVHHADRLADFAGRTGGVRFGQPDEAWTQSQIRALVQHVVVLAKENNIDPHNPFG
jgi:hypothetical protein